MYFLIVMSDLFLDVPTVTEWDVPEDQVCVYEGLNEGQRPRVNPPVTPLDDDELTPSLTVCE